MLEISSLRCMPAIVPLDRETQKGTLLVECPACAIAGRHRSSRWVGTFDKRNLESFDILNDRIDRVEEANLSVFEISLAYHC